MVIEFSDRDQVAVAFRRLGIPQRRADWIQRELASELESAAMRVVAAHPDVQFWLDEAELIPDLRATVTDLLGDAALQNGAVDGRTTEEVAAAVGVPDRQAFSALSHPRSGLAQSQDGRWYPKADPR